MEFYVHFLAFYCSFVLSHCQFIFLRELRLLPCYTRCLRRFRSSSPPRFIFKLFQSLSSADKPVQLIVSPFPRSNHLVFFTGDVFLHSGVSCIAQLTVTFLVSITPWWLLLFGLTPAASTCWALGWTSWSSAHADRFVKWREAGWSI